VKRPEKEDENKPQTYYVPRTWNDCHSQWEKFLPDREEIEDIIVTCWVKEGDNENLLFDITDAIHKRLQGD